jgi:deoxyribonuclease V
LNAKRYGLRPNPQGCSQCHSRGRLDSQLEGRLIDVQKRIASRIVLEDDYSDDAVAGVDEAFLDDLVISGAVVLDRSQKIIGKACHAARTKIPYVPGFLSFREGPAAIQAVRRLNVKPTLIFVDGCGINHPRTAGLASYVGVILDIPTIGVSKNVLCGRCEIPKGIGEARPLAYGGRVVGHVLKSKKGCRPIVIAPGHRVSVDSSLRLALRYLKDRKLPEPCRLAHEYANFESKRLAQTALAQAFFD